MFKLENIYKHLKTTVLAVVIFLVSMIFVWFEKASFSEVWPAWLAVLGFFFYGKPPQGGQMPNFKKMGALMILVLLFTSCSPQQRLARLVKKHPHLETTITDTIRFSAQVITHADTQAAAVSIKAIDTLRLRDTIRLPGEAYNVYILKTHTDSVIITVEGIADTVFIEKEVIIKNQQIKNAAKAPNELKNYFIYAILFLGALLLFYVLIKAFQK